jgi:hypothetical protein
MDCRMTTSLFNSWNGFATITPADIALWEVPVQAIVLPVNAVPEEFNNRVVE